VGVHGLSGSSRIKDDVAVRQRDAAQELLWEERRIDAAWEVEEVEASSPGAFLLLWAVFERGRGAFCFLGERGLPSEILGERAARRLLRFLDNDDAAVDACLADQLAVPLALAGGGGRVSTPEVTTHLETVAAVVTRFGIPARTWGRHGGPGGLEVERC
jgi:RNA 3'-terminal phosphate cyclase